MAEEQQSQQASSSVYQCVPRQNPCHDAPSQHQPQHSHNQHDNNINKTHNNTKMIVMTAHDFQQHWEQQDHQNAADTTTITTTTATTMNKEIMMHKHHHPPLQKEDNAQEDEYDSDPNGYNYDKNDNENKDSSSEQNNDPFQDDDGDDTNNADDTNDAPGGVGRHKIEEQQQWSSRRPPTQDGAQNPQNQRKRHQPKATHQLTEAAKRNIARFEARMAEYEAMSAEERDRLVIHPNDTFYRARYYSPVVVPQFRLVFIPIPKVACTQWLQLFRRMAGFSNWKQRDNGLPYTPDVNGLTYLSDYSLREANDIWTSSNYTRAVFVRDPKERFLSAYLDKVVATQHIARGACCPRTRDCVSSQTTLEEFVALTETCDNEHWAVQSDRLPGPHLWKYINFVGYMDHLEQDAKRLLQHIGAWETYGATGWGRGDSENSTASASSIFADAAGESAARQHATQAQARLRHYYTPALERIIERRYKKDYTNPYFRLPRRRIFVAEHTKQRKEKQTKMKNLPNHVTTGKAKNAVVGKKRVKLRTAPKKQKQ